VSVGVGVVFSGLSPLVVEDVGVAGSRLVVQGKQPKLPLTARKTIHRRYHDPDDDASLADLAEEYSVGRSTIHRIISSATPPRA
jgi:hypothetical protein